MELRKSLKLTNKYCPLLLVPIILDLLQIVDIQRYAQEFNLKFILPSAIPSITQLLNTANKGGSTLNINLPFTSELDGYWLTVILILYYLLGAYLKGGFLGCIFKGVQDEPLSLRTYLQMANKYFERFLYQSLLVLAILFGFFTLMMATGQMAFLFMFGLFLLTFFLIFWDYALVAEDVGVIEAAKISLARIKGNFGKVLRFVVPIIIITALCSILVNFLVGAGTIMTVVAIVFNAYYGTTVIFTLMGFYWQISHPETCEINHTLSEDKIQS